MRTTFGPAAGKDDMTKHAPTSKGAARVTKMNESRAQILLQMFWCRRVCRESTQRAAEQAVQKDIPTMCSHDISSEALPQRFCSLIAAKPALAI